MSKRISGKEVEERGLSTDVILRPTDPAEPLPEASVQATSKVVHAYQPPPVIDLQDAVVPRGRRPLPAETPAHRRAEIDARDAAVAQLGAEIKRDTHTGYADHVTTAEDNARALNQSVDAVRRDMARAKQFTPREVVIQRESVVHQQNVDMIMAEMAGTIRTDDYSSGA